MMFLSLLGCHDANDSAIDTNADPPDLAAIIVGARDTWGDDAALWSLDDRNEVQMVFGPSGGWHLSLDLEITGLTREQFEISSGTAIETSGEHKFDLGGPQVVLVPDPDGDGAGRLEDLRLYAIWTDHYDTLCPLAGRSLQLSFDLEERETGRSATAARLVTAALDPLNLGSCAEP